MSTAAKTSGRMTHDLWGLTAEWRRLLAGIEMAEGAIDDAAEAALSSLATATPDSLDDARRVVLHLDADIEAIDMEIVRLQQRKKMRANLRARVKDAMRDAMAAAGERSVDTPLARYTLMRGREAVVIDDGVEVPDEYARVVRSPDKKAIGDALKAGADLAFARFERGDDFLVIK